MLQAAGAAQGHTEASGPTIACLAWCSRRSRCHSSVAGWASATMQLCVRGCCQLHSCNVSGAQVAGAGSLSLVTMQRRSTAAMLGSCHAAQGEQHS